MESAPYTPNTDQGDIPRVLLLTGTPPDTSGVGALFLRDLCASYPAGYICCYSFVPKGSTVSSASDFGDLPIMIRKGRRESIYTSIVGKAGKTVALLVSEYVLRRYVESRVNEIIAFAKEHEVNTVWAVLDCPIVIYIAERLKKMMKVQLVSQVWDAPEYLSEYFAIESWRRKNLMTSFANVMSQSSCCGVASESMAIEYFQRYGTKAVVIRPGLDSRLQQKYMCTSSHSDLFVIGFAGSLYAKKEWDALLRALHTVNWRIGNRLVVIRVMGYRFMLESDYPVNIEYFGWRTMEDTVAILAEVDICYLPYWFDSDKELETRLAFPGKLSTYLGIGKPVFFHGPDYSSVAQFFKRFPAGVCCHSLTEIDIIDKLSLLASDEVLYKNACAAGHQAVEEELNLEVCRHRFAEMLGLHTTMLRTLPPPCEEVVQ